VNLLDALLRRLEEEQAEHAKRALAQPQNRDSFEYGRVAGIYAGLDRVREILLEIREAHDRADDEL
jgi:hypothetical protein